MAGNQYEKRCKVCEGRLDIEGNEEYCSYCLPKPKDPNTPKTVTKKKKETKYKDERKYIDIKCTGPCGRTYHTRVHPGFEKIYTPEVIANYKCLLCSNPSQKKSSWSNY